MRLTLMLLRRRHMPNGHIYRGKDRIVKPVTQDQLQKLKNDFEIEERNMFYLRHPYLTLEQSHGHVKALNKPSPLALKIEEQRLKFKKNITIEERLAHLRYKEAWD